jgi:hypothetical protein
MARTAGYNLLDHRRNEDILEELRIEPSEKKLKQYKQKWLNQVNRLEDLIDTPKQLLNYRPIGRRRPGRLLKRQLEG